MAATSFTTGTTIGQASPPGTSASAGYQFDAGFWYTALPGLLVGDVNGDGVVDLEDLIVALQVITGQTPDDLLAAADMNGDGRIGIVEAIAILREIGGLPW